MFQGSSPFSDYVDMTFIVIVAISTIVLAGLMVAMIFFVFRYSRKRNPQATQIEGNLSLEITWTVIPLLLFMGMFYLGWKGYLKEIDVPEGAIPIKVTGKMWEWSFQYPNGVVTDTLYVPVKTPVRLTLVSLDVNHSLYIPAFRIKKDVIPNRENVMWFETPVTGAYDIACAEFCGLNHAYMYTKLIAQDSLYFEQWYQGVSQLQSKPYSSLISREKEEGE